MESIYTELALYGSKKVCARTDNVFPPISEVYDGTVSLDTDFIKLLKIDTDFQRLLNRYRES